MRLYTGSLQSRLYMISAALFFIGMACSSIIYIMAEDDSRSVMGYEIRGNDAYLVTPENSKKYVHDLKLMGGNAAVFADELGRWFTGLWHGERLAFTSGIITILISAGFFLAARTTPPDRQ